MARRRTRALDGERDEAGERARTPVAHPGRPNGPSGGAVPALTQLQEAAGNAAVGALIHRDTPHVQRCACGEATVDASEQPSVVQRLGFVDDLASVVGGLFGEQGEELDAKAPAACSESPNWQPVQSIPVDIRADTAVEFVSKVKGALGGNPHMQPNVSWAPDVDDKGRVTAVHFSITTKIVRPRFAGGRPSEEERQLITKVEDLIKAHEERHRDIAKDFAQRAVCAALGKSSAGTPAPYEVAINKTMCAMNKAQEDLDHKEGTLKWTLDSGGTKVLDVALAPEPSASYPC